MELVFNFLKQAKTYNYVIDAIEEYMPILLDAYAEIDAQLVSDFPEDPDIPELPEHIYLKLPIFSIAIDLRQLGEDFVAAWNLAASKIDLLIENASWIKTLNDRFDAFLELIPIPLTDQFTYVQYYEVDTDEQPDEEWILDSWFEYIKNETTDVWSVVAVGEDFTPPVSLSVIIIWKAFVYWKVFKILYKAAQKTGLIELSRKFASKVLKIPTAIYNRYSLKRKLHKQSLYIVEELDENFPDLNTKIETIDTIADGLAADLNLTQLDIDYIKQRFLSAYSPQKGILQFQTGNTSVIDDIEEAGDIIRPSRYPKGFDVFLKP